MNLYKMDEREFRGLEPQLLENVEKSSLRERIENWENVYSRPYLSRGYCEFLPPSDMGWEGEWGWEVKLGILRRGLCLCDKITWYFVRQMDERN